MKKVACRDEGSVLDMEGVGSGVVFQGNLTGVGAVKCWLPAKGRQHVIIWGQKVTGTG